MGGAKGIAMLDLLIENIKSLASSEELINEVQFKDEPMSYKVTVCVECTWPSNQYWEPMLKDTRIRQTDDFVSQLVSSMQALLEEVACISDDNSELDHVSSLHCYLDEYKEEWGI